MLIQKVRSGGLVSDRLFPIGTVVKVDIVGRFGHRLLPRKGLPQGWYCSQHSWAEVAKEDMGEDLLY